LKIGIVGIGRMGAAIAHRLIGLGHEVTVWNRSMEKARALEAAGARAAATPAELASRADIVLSILTDAKAIDAAYRGPQGLLSGDVAGKLFVEMSTVRPETQRALAADVSKRGAALIDCPVGGTVTPAREGRLIGFAGGEAADVARARPVLEQLCRRFEHVGPVGAGESLKLAINLPLLVYWQALGEALSLCKSLDIDPARLMDIIGDTSAAPSMLKLRGPMIATALAGGKTGPVTFDIDSICKDLHTMAAEAKALGLRVPVTERALELIEEAAREGHGAEDGIMLPVRWVKGAGKQR